MNQFIIDLPELCTQQMKSAKLPTFLYPGCLNVQMFQCQIRLREAFIKTGGSIAVPCHKRLMVFVKYERGGQSQCDICLKIFFFFY